MRRRKNRRSPRLAGYDYRRAGLYFVTICTADRACIFGEVADGEMRLSALGEIAHAEWDRTFALRPCIVPDMSVVMPNHVHLLFGLPDASDDGGPSGRDAETDRRAEIHLSPTDGLRPTTVGPTPAAIGSPAGSVPAIIGTYKAAVTRQARRLSVWNDSPLWQARFHDRIVRDNREAERIRRYIVENPLRWHVDRYVP